MQETKPTNTASRPFSDNINNIPPSSTPVLTNNTKKPTSNSKKIIFLIIALLIFITSMVLFFYFLYLRPRQITLNFIQNLQPQVSALQTSTKSVSVVIDNIHSLVTQETMDNIQPLETSGLLLSPKLAYFNETKNILGTQTHKDLSWLEENTIFFQQETKAIFTSFINHNTNIFGIQTSSENIYIQKNRQLKDQTLKANEYLSHASKDLDLMIKTSLSPPSGISQSAKNQIQTSAKVKESITPYFAQVQKVSDYYQTISDTLITINDKIASFKNSINSAASILGDISQINTQPLSFKTKTSQAQIFLDQAKKDTDEINNLAITLKNIPKDNLPLESQEYHNHNIAVLNTVSDYFASKSAVVQGFLTAYKSLSNKIDAGELTISHLNLLQPVILSAVHSEETADAKFASDLQSLLGEEKTLTLSFWQNNIELAKGDLVLAEINNYEKTLNILKEKNKTF